MKNNSTKIFFLAILILAFALRFYQLGKIPISLDWDEVSNAYNAYSILKTGRDEYGNFLPLTNRSFDDYKPPLYMYLEVPSVAVFGLTPFAARLPSAVFGFLTVPLIYFLAKVIFEDLVEEKRENLGLLAMFIFSVSPWNLQFSRVGFEANVGLFFAAASICTALYGLKKYWLLPISALLLDLSLYSYHSERLFMPIFYLVLIRIFWGEITKIPKKYLLQFIFVAIVLIVPLFLFAPRQAIFNRFESTSQGSYLNEVNTSINFINTDKNSHFPFGNIIHNRRIIIAQSTFGSYIKHFDLNFLFLTGDDNPRHHVENMGMLYLFELPFILIAIYQLLKNPSSRKLLVFAWLLLAPLPASLSNTSPHAIRSYLMVIPLEILSAMGIFWVLGKLKGRFKVITVSILTICVIFSIFAYLENYYLHYPNSSAVSWQFPYKKAVLASENYADQGQKVYVSPTVDQSYIFWLFYTKYDPAKYQSLGNKNHFSNYFFFSPAPKDTGSIYVSTNLNSDFKTLNTLKDPSGKPVILIGVHK